MKMKIDTPDQVLFSPSAAEAGAKKKKGQWYAG